MVVENSSHTHTKCKFMETFSEHVQFQFPILAHTLWYRNLVYTYSTVLQKCTSIYKLCICNLYRVLFNDKNSNMKHRVLSFLLLAKCIFYSCFFTLFVCLQNHNKISLLLYFYTVITCSAKNYLLGFKKHMYL